MSTNTICPVFPFIEDQAGVFKTIPEDEVTKAVDQNIKMVLLTVPGEWIGRPYFGVGLRKYLFENFNSVDFGNSDFELQPLRQNILSQLETFIPYITVQELQIFNDENTLSISLKYFINNTSLASTYDITVSQEP